MEYRRLGKSGLKVSALSLGSWVTFGKQVDINIAKILIKAAYDAGVNFFDNAEGYMAGASERIMGEAIAGLGLPRSSYIVSSKVFWGGSLPTQRGLSAKHVRDACDAALTRLKVDYLDLYFCHRPDVETPIAETVRAMDNLIRQGKVLYWGTSEWSAQQITEAHLVAQRENLTPPTMEQPQYNMLHRQRFEQEYQPLYDNFGMGSTVFSPLRSGILTGKYVDGVPENSRLNLEGYEGLRDQLLKGDDTQEKVRKLMELAQSLNISVASLAIAWVLKNPNVSTAILGASKLNQLEENLHALEALPLLTNDIMAAIETILDNRPAAPERF